MRFFESQRGTRASVVEYSEGPLIITLKNRGDYNLVQAFLHSYKGFSPDPEMKIGKFDYTGDERLLTFSIAASHVLTVLRDFSAAKIISPTLCDQIKKYVRTGEDHPSSSNERTPLLDFKK